MIKLAFDFAGRSQARNNSPKQDAAFDLQGRKAQATLDVGLGYQPTLCHRCALSAHSEQGFDCPSCRPVVSGPQQDRRSEFRNRKQQALIRTIRKSSLSSQVLFPNASVKHPRLSHSRFLESLSKRFA